MTTTETWWMVSKADDGDTVELRRTSSGNYFWDTEYAHRFPTRLAAEEEAAKHDGAQVVECTLTCRPVGLRWEDRGCDLFDLFDGAKVIGQIVKALSGYWRISSLSCWPMFYDGYGRTFKTEGEARAAAEAAVRAKWGDNK